MMIAQSKRFPDRRMFALLKNSFALCFLVVSLCSSAHAQFVFNRADFPTGQNPNSVAVADVNGDGRADLLVANASDSSVSVFLGQPDGSFSAKQDIATNVGASVIVTGDFNGDGNVDVIAGGGCGAGCGSISILFGHGDGTFAPPSIVPSTASPAGMATADFNHDSKLDFVTGDNCGKSCGNVWVFEGNGDGTFKPGVVYPVGGSPVGITVSDLNGDGATDMVSVNYSGSISVLMANGDGTFKPDAEVPSPNLPSDVAVGDLDGDKIPDLAIAHNGGDGAITVMKGVGDGSFLPEQTIVSGLYANILGFADVNGDGHLDLLIPAVLGGGLEVYIGKGDLTFNPPITYAAGNYPEAFAVADVNGDKELDIVVADPENNRLAVLLGNGHGTFSPRVDLPIPQSIAQRNNVLAGVTADFNGDGFQDVVETFYSGATLLVAGKGDGSFNIPVTVNAGTDQVSAVGDINRDGHPDLMLLGNFGEKLDVMLGNGDGTFRSPATVLNTSPSNLGNGVVLGDFNGDGRLDYAALGNGFLEKNPFYLGIGNGDGTFKTASQSWNLSSYPTRIVAGDLNRDGKLDLAITLNPQGFVVLLGKGDGTFANSVLYGNESVPGGIVVADLNGDGFPDVVVTGDTVDVFLNKGDGTLLKSTSFNGGNFPGAVTAGDFNGDGKMDLAVAAEGAAAAGNIEILLGNGDGTFLSPVEINDGSTVMNTIAAADFNNDGSADVYGSTFTGSVYVSRPIATIGPVAVDFGRVGVGATSEGREVTIGNNGQAPLNISKAVVSAPFQVSDNACGTALEVGKVCTISVVFSPSAVGSATGSLTLTENALSAVQSVAMSGVGISATTTALTVTPNPAIEGTAVSIAAKVSGTPTPTGNVVFNDGTTAIGTVGLDSSGVASYVTTALALGSHSIVAVYQGDTNDAGSTSATVTEVVSAPSPPDYSVSATSVTISTGKTGTLGTSTLTLTPANGFTGTITLGNCVVPGNFTGGSCSVPATVSITGSTAATATLTISSTATSAQATPDVLPEWWKAGGGIVLASAFLWGFPGRRRRIGDRVVIAFLAGLLMTLAACGGGSGGGSKTPTATISAGTYSFTLNATSGTLSHPVTVSVTVE